MSQRETLMMPSHHHDSAKLEQLTLSGNSCQTLMKSSSYVKPQANQAIQQGRSSKLSLISYIRRFGGM